MKVYHAMHENSPDISKEDKEKMAILKLVDVGKYIKNVGIRDGQFYVIAENDTDEVYLEYKAAMQNIQALMNTKMDFRLLEQKNREFHTKRLNAMQKVMEMPK
jgi:nitrate reductase NapAB chaperone NapD